jgi:hypothetical protein
MNRHIENQLSAMTWDALEKGKGRRFTSKFIEPGIIKYSDDQGKPYVALVKKEAIDRFIGSIVGCPLIIKHHDVNKDTVEDLRCGIISEVHYNVEDGWYHCSGIVWDEQAIKNIEELGWSVSCTYVITDEGEGGVYHDMKYDVEFMNGDFEHLALVENPRYEEATIVMNSKGEPIRKKAGNSKFKIGDHVNYQGKHGRVTGISGKIVEGDYMDGGSFRVSEDNNDLVRVTKNDAFGKNIIRVTFRTKRGSDDPKYLLTEEFSSMSTAKLRASALNWDIVSTEEIRNESKNATSQWKCQECGNHFDKNVPASGEMKCPKCKSTDIDMNDDYDNSRENSTDRKDAIRRKIEILQEEIDLLRKEFDEVDNKSEHAMIKTAKSSNETQDNGGNAMFQKKSENEKIMEDVKKFISNMKDGIEALCKKVGNEKAKLLEPLTKAMNAAGEAFSVNAKEEDEDEKKKKENEAKEEKEKKEKEENESEAESAKDDEDKEKENESESENESEDDEDEKDEKKAKAKKKNSVKNESESEDELEKSKKARNEAPKEDAHATGYMTMAEREKLGKELF